jgi:V/A-type H+/Na+-transporting ATPase subunit F
MKYSIIGDEDAVMGFGIVGIQGRVAANAEQARQAFETLQKDPDIGIILITERVAEMIRPLMDAYMLSTSFPLMVEVPDRKGPLPDRVGIQAMVNKAIGIKI